jgi:hypothetical protein
MKGLLSSNQEPPCSPKVGATDDPDAYEDHGKTEQAERGKVFVKYCH